MIPASWGRHFWTTIHIAAMGYPENPTFEDKVAYKEFYMTIGKVLPCKKCTINFARHIADMPIDSYLIHGKRKLFDWTVYLHNTVNKELGRPQWNTDYAWSHYQNLCQKTSQGKNTTLPSNALYHTHIALAIINVIIVFVLIYKLSTTR